MFLSVMRFNTLRSATRVPTRRMCLDIVMTVILNGDDEAMI